MYLSEQKFSISFIYYKRNFKLNLLKTIPMGTIYNLASSWKISFSLNKAVSPVIVKFLVIDEKYLNNKIHANEKRQYGLLLQSDILKDIHVCICYLIMLFVNFKMIVAFKLKY